MTFKIADRIRETNVVSGIGSVTTGGAIVGFRTFASFLSVGDTTWYELIDSTANVWEVGVGTFGAGNTLSRAPIASSNGGSLVSFAGNACDCFVGLPASAVSGFATAAALAAEVATARAAEAANTSAISINTGAIAANTAAISAETTARLAGDAANVPVSRLNGGTGASSSSYWSGDGTWKTPAGAGGVTTLNTRSGAVTLTLTDIPTSGAASGNVLGFNGLAVGWTAPSGGASYTPTVYTASGALALTDSVSVVNSGSATTMTLANDTVDGRVRDVKRYGAGAVSLTAVIDGVSQTILMNTAATVKENVTLQWIAGLSSYIVK